MSFDTNTIQPIRPHTDAEILRHMLSAILIREMVTNELHVSTDTEEAA